MEQLKEIVYDRVHNQKWFTARGLKTLAGATGWGEEALARLIACILFLILVTSKNWIVCNSILVGVSLLLMYVFPDERPPAENMRVYWISAFVVTAFDRMLEAFPLYYVGKLCALLFLLVEPSCLNERLKTLLKLTTTSLSENLKEQKKPLREVKRAEKEKDVDKGNELASAIGKFAGSLLTAIGSTRSSNPTPPTAPTVAPRKSPSPSRPKSEGSLQGAVKTATPRSKTLSGERSAPVPTPYDAKPISTTARPTLASGQSVARAPTATGPPVGVGERRSIASTYVNLPKPAGRSRASLRLDPTPQRGIGSKTSDPKKPKNAPIHAKVPK